MCAPKEGEEMSEAKHEEMRDVLPFVLHFAEEFPGVTVDDLGGGPGPGGKMKPDAETVGDPS